MELFHLAEDRDRGRTAVIPLVNLLVLQSDGSFLTAWRTTSFQEALYTTDSVTS